MSWIKADERLPEVDESGWSAEVIVIMRNGLVGSGYLQVLKGKSNLNWHLKLPVVTFEPVVYWQPYPAGILPFVEDSAMPSDEEAA